jgi:hypothetical protein
VKITTWIAYLLVVLALLVLALLFAPPAAAKPAPGYTPVCTSVQIATAMLDGLYAAVSCPQGRITVSRRGDQPLPALGPARVAPASAAGFYDLVDAAGQRYRIGR